MRKISSILAAAAVCASPALAQDAVTLEWKWTKGAVLRYRMTQDQNQKMAIPTDQGMMEQRTSQKQSFVWRQMVQDVTPEGLATVFTTYESVRVETTMPMGGGTLTYDSTNPADVEKAKANPMLNPLAALVGESFTMKIDRTGKVHEVTGYDKILEKLLARQLEAMAENPRDRWSSPGMVRTAPLLKQTFGNDSMKSLIEASFRSLPSGPAKVGDTWQSSLSSAIPMVGAMRFDYTYKLAGFEQAAGQECAKIGFDATITHVPGDPNAGQPADNPFAGVFDLSMKSGATKGENLFAKERGILVKSVIDTTMDIDVNLKIPKGAGGPQGQNIPKQLSQTLEQRMTMELLDGEAGAPAREETPGGAPSGEFR